MQLFATLCNNPGGPHLVCVDVISGASVPVDIRGLPDVETVTGIARIGGRLVLGASRGDEGGLLLLEPDGDGFVVVKSVWSTDLYDVHGIDVGHDGLYVACTRADAVVFCADVETLEFGVVYRMGEGGDRHHLNDVKVVSGKVCVSAFHHRGRMPGASWRGCQFGVVREVGGREWGTFFHPHSVEAWGGDLYWLESGTGCVVKADPDAVNGWRYVLRMWSLFGPWWCGYVRGLWFGEVYGERVAAVGVSQRRGAGGRSQVLVFRVADVEGDEKWQLWRDVDVGEYGREIFDIVGW